jgi:hypothetical protein
VPATPEAQLQDALSIVQGWRGGIEEVIRRTPPETLSRSRIRDRWGARALARQLSGAAGSGWRFWERAASDVLHLAA